MLSNVSTKCVTNGSWEIQLNGKISVIPLYPYEGRCLSLFNIADVNIEPNETRKIPVLVWKHADGKCTMPMQMQNKLDLRHLGLQHNENFLDASNKVFISVTNITSDPISISRHALINRIVKDISKIPNNYSIYLDDYRDNNYLFNNHLKERSVEDIYKKSR